ncbi:MAG: DUF4347 domain-containing protein, partial [Lysobacterales bacterium]
MARRSSKAPNRRALMEELEPRILFSADPASLLLDPAHQAGDGPAASPAIIQFLSSDDQLGQASEQTSRWLSAGVNDQRRELVFVDTSAPNYQQLIKDLIKASAEGRSIEVVVLDSSRDGIEQISEALAERRDIDAVHIASHGTDGTLKLGSTELKRANLKTYAKAIEAWGKALTADADLLLYGCDFAETRKGQNMVKSMDDLTGADVAASTDVTGSSALGGDWVLEYQEGEIEAQVVFSSELQHEWQGTLNIAPPVNNVPGVQATDEEVPLTFSVAVGNQISISDADAGYNPVKITLTATNGLVSLSNISKTVESQVNTQTVNAQSNAAMAMDANGNYVVVWYSVDQDNKGIDALGGIYAQRYDATGNTQGGEILVNSTVTGDQLDPTVAMSADGKFVVAWEGPDGKNGDIFAQRFAADGTKRGGEIPVNTTTGDDQTEPAVAMADSGDFVVTWTSKNQDNGDGKKGIYAQLYFDDGTTNGGEFLVNDVTVGDQKESAVAMESNGDFVVTWTGRDADKGGVFAERFDANGNSLGGGEFQVSTYTNDDQKTPTIAMDDDGDFVIAWYSKVQDGGNGGIYAQRYDNTGATVGTEFAVATGAGEQTSPSAAMDADGDFVIAWESADASLLGIYTQRYDSLGAAVGGATLFNTETALDQALPAIAMDSQGGYAIAWDSDGQD